MMKSSSYTHTHSCKTSPLLGVQVLIFTRTALWVPQKSRAGATSAHVKMDFNCCSVILFSLQGPSQLLHTSHVSFIFLFKVLLHCFKSLSVIPWLLFNLDDGHHHLQQHHWANRRQFWLFQSHRVTLTSILVSCCYPGDFAALLLCPQQCTSVFSSKVEGAQYERKNYLGRKVKWGRQGSRSNPQK